MLPRRVLFEVLVLALVPGTLWSEEPRVEVSAGTPPLSLETLYHPEQKFDYLPEPTPPMRWFQGDGEQPWLLIKRKDGWVQLDPRDGSEQAFPLEAVLANQLHSLGGLDQQQSLDYVREWIRNPQHSLAAGLAQIGDAIALIGTEVQPRLVSRATKGWQEVSLSPDAQRIAYVESNDLYVLQLDTGAVTRVTDTGSPTLLNGLLDWVYQEELYGRGNYRGYWWSPDGNSLAFLRLDTSEVATFTLTRSQPPRGETIVQQYPKAGDPIPRAEVWSVRLDRSSADGVTVMPLLQGVTERDTLITRVGWQKADGMLLVQTSNRIQNEVSLWKVDPLDPGMRRQLLREQCDRWLEVQELPTELAGGDYLRLSDLPSGRRRLWRISADGSTRSPLTPDDFDVREVVYVDPAGRFARVIGDRLRGTVGQQLYQVDLEKSADLQRLTDEVAWHEVSISEDGRWLVDRASSLTSPPTVWLRQVGEPAERSRRLHRERWLLRDPPGEVTWPLIDTRDGVTLPAYLLRPSGPQSSESFPVLLEVYGGPLAPSVRDIWSGTRHLFHQMLAREGIAVLVVDNRSSGGRGLTDCWTIYRRVGEQETQDLVAAVDWLGQQSWADAQRLALRGWSFGGFLTLHAMTHSDRFAAGIAGGSVTDWRNYDAIYTERYMDLPQQNPAGYDATSPILAAAKIHGRVLLLHGEVDDNVHLANTLQMAAALQKSGKPFDLMIYPNQAHGVHDPAQNYHLMRTTVEFLKRELGIDAHP